MYACVCVWWCESKELDDYMWTPSTCDLNAKASKSGEYLDIKNWSCKKRLFGKLLLACKDEILFTLLNDKKVTCEKNNCLFGMISLLIISLLLSLWLVANTIIQGNG